MKKKEKPARTDFSFELTWLRIRIDLLNLYSPERFPGQQRPLADEDDEFSLLLRSFSQNLLEHRSFWAFSVSESFLFFECLYSFQPLSEVPGMRLCQRSFEARL